MYKHNEYDQKRSSFYWRREEGYRNLSLFLSEIFRDRVKERGEVEREGDIEKKRVRLTEGERRREVESERE